MSEWPNIHPDLRGGSYRGEQNPLPFDDLAKSPTGGGNWGAVSIVEQIQNEYFPASLENLAMRARIAITEYEAYLSSLEDDSQPKFIEPERVEEPSPIVYALSRANEPWKGDFSNAQRAGLFYWTPELRDSLTKEGKYLLDRVLWPVVSEMSRMNQGSVLRLHLGDTIVGSEIEQKYRLGDGSFPSDGERKKYATDLDALRDYARALGGQLYGGRRPPSNFHPLKPEDIRIEVRDGRVRVTRG